MTAPWDGFGAHDGGAGSVGDSNEFGEAFGKLRSGHVVGVAAKRGVAPSGVDGVFAAVAAAAEGFEVGVLNSGRVERGRERVGIELGDVPGLGDGTDINEMADALGVQQGKELFNRVRGVTDGEEDLLRHSSMIASSVSNARWHKARDAEVEL